jgi:hypothetical protein
VLHKNDDVDDEAVKGNKKHFKSVYTHLTRKDAEVQFKYVGFNEQAITKLSSTILTVRNGWRKVLRDEEGASMPDWCPLDLVYANRPGAPKGSKRKQNR